MNEHNRELLLSLFPGADLFGRGFEELGWCVVRGPDVLWGQDVRLFTPARHAFQGVFGGSPCQEFSSSFRGETTGYGIEMMNEFVRCVVEASPVWFLHENVARVPDLVVPGRVTPHVTELALALPGKSQ